jgi:prevent-host-death family protein
MDKIDKMYILVILAYPIFMQRVSATEAKQNFAAMLDKAQREPVRIRRHDRDVAVLVSSEEYERLSKNRWAEFDRLASIAAEQAKSNGLTESALADILAE